MSTELSAMMCSLPPDAWVEWYHVRYGAVATALLFTVGKYLIRLHIGGRHVASADGAAGALLIILPWIDYSAQIVRFGAEFAKACADHRRRPRTERAACSAGDGGRERGGQTGPA
jgi:membrane protein